MKTITSLIVLSLCLSCQAAQAQQPLPTARKHPERAPKHKRQEKDLSGRILKGKLLAKTSTSMAVALADGKGPIKARVTSESIFHPNSGDAALASFPLQQDIVGEFEFVAGDWALRELWDTASWESHLLRHRGEHSGKLTGLSAHTIDLGALRYSLTKDVAWTKQGRSAERTGFKVGDMVYVTGSTSSDVPTATRISDAPFPTIGAPR